MHFTFSKEYRFCPLDGNEHLNLTHVEASGSDLEEMLDNCMISLEDWNGNDPFLDWDLGDLPDNLIEMITQDIGAHMQECLDQMAERHAEDRAIICDLNARRVVR